jgi:hypothetical protein
MFTEYLSEVDLEQPATQTELEKIREMADRLPTDFFEFLKMSNGAEGWVGEQYLGLYSIKELIENQIAYEVDKYLPGMFLFGTNGGGEAYLFDLRQLPSPIVRAQFSGGLSFEDCEFVANSFENFLKEMTNRRG